MSVVQPIRRSEVWLWLVVGLFAAFLVLVALVRVAGANPAGPKAEPKEAYIVSPLHGSFIAGKYPGAEPYVHVGSPLELGTVVGNIEVWGRLYPVRSMMRGSVLEVQAFDGAVVAAGQHLFKVQIESKPSPI
jgi:biotin carboxyl carrier protein